MSEDFGNDFLVQSFTENGFTIKIIANCCPETANGFIYDVDIYSNVNNEPVGTSAEGGFTIKPNEFVDSVPYHRLIKEAFDDLHTRYDNFPQK